MFEQGYQLSSGIFLKLYLIIAGWALVFTIIGLAVAAIYMCCKGKDSGYFALGNEDEAAAEGEDAEDQQPKEKSTREKSDRRGKDRGSRSRNP